MILLIIAKKRKNGLKNTVNVNLKMHIIKNITS